MVFLSFSGADRLQGKSAQKCGPRPSVPRNRRNSSRVRSECAGAGPLGPRGRGTAAAGRVDGARRARAQIPGVGKGLTLSSALSLRRDSVRRHRPSTKSLRPTSAFRWANCTALLAGILLATSELATVPRATCEAQVNMVSLLG